MNVCMMHTSMILDLDTWMYDAYIYDPWSWCMYVWCGKFCSERTDKAILGVWYGYDAHMYDAFPIMFDPDTCNACMMHISMFLDHWSWYMRVWCTKQWSWPLILKRVCMHDASMILVPDPECMMHVTMHLFPGFVYIWCFLMHVCMMHISIILDPSPWCMYVWCTDVWCTMHKSMILFHDPDDAWIWGGVCIYDAVLFGDGRTNGRTRRF